MPTCGSDFDVATAFAICSAVYILYNNTGLSCMYVSVLGFSGAGNRLAVIGGVVLSRTRSTYLRPRASGSCETT